MIDAIDNDKLLPIISTIKAVELLILLWDDVSTTPVQKPVFLTRRGMTTPTIHFHLKIFHRKTSFSR